MLLKIADTGVPLPLEDNNTAQIGEKVYTLGYQDHDEYKSISGTFQSRYRNNKWFQIKTDFYLGVGGGPVLNSKNEVIGVITHANGPLMSVNTTFATAISSNVLKVLLANSGKVMPLEQWQKHSRIRAYALEGRADEKADQSDNRDAIIDYNAALKLNPDLVEIYSKRGMLKGRIRDFRGTLRDCEKMIQINPEHAFAYNNRASAKANLGDVQGAIDDFNKAVEINSEYIMAHVNLGEIKMQIAESKTDEGDIVETQRYYQEAIDHYTKAIALNPKNPVPRKHIRRAERMLRLSKSNPK